MSLDLITAATPPSKIMVRFGGWPYLVTFTGTIGIECFCGSLIFRGESDDANITVEEDHKELARQRKLMSELHSGTEQWYEWLNDWRLPRSWTPTK